jgi:alpha-D-ribose 1-methylphosphonate 5-triphosphate synthase subunit PhnH
MTPKALTGGFSDAPLQSALAFRAILQAMARPGTIHEVAGALPPAPLSVAAGVALLTLADQSTPVYLAGATDTDAVRDWLAFHLGAPVVGAADAEFALGTWDDLQPVSRFRIGQPDYPDRSATLIVEVDRLEPEGARLTGPGIRQTARLNLPGIEDLQTNAAMFPLGFDCLLACGTRLAALPRSTRLEVC